MGKNNNTVTDMIVGRLDKIDSKLDRIEKQTTITNGRVSKVEDTVTGHVEQFKNVFSRLNSVEKAQSVFSALRRQASSNSRFWIDLLIKVGPWFITVLFGVFLVLQETGVFGF